LQEAANLNNKGQFSIIAALLVAVVLVGAVMSTYSAVRYNTAQEQPQILSAVDETNLALKQILGFTVGYYGSVLKVTGNVTYARQLAINYLNSGLNNMGGIRPEWGATFKATNLSLNVNWFSNHSYSQGTLNVNYDLNGLGIAGVSYSTSTRLDVQISKANSTSQAQLKISTDDNEPLINLGRSNLKFYKYAYANLTWGLMEPTNITSYADGTYLVDLPEGVVSTSYSIQVQDIRGLMAIASSFSQFTTKIAWNSTGFQSGFDYVDNDNLIIGTQANFTAQQSGPDGIYDTLIEQPLGLGALNYYPLHSNLMGFTTIAQSSGNITTDTDNKDGNYLELHSYPSAFSSQTATLGYSTHGLSTQSIEGRITGSLFTTITGGQVQYISANVDSTSNQNRDVKVAIYAATDNSLVAFSATNTIAANFNGWVTFTFTDPKPLLSASTDYLLVAWADSGQGTVSLYYDSGSANQGYSDSRTFGNWPSPDNNLNSDSARKYSINCTYTMATQYTAQAEFTGTSDLANWQKLTWSVDSAVTAGTAICTIQFCNFAVGPSGQYSTSGDGYNTVSLTTIDQTQTQTINTNPSNFRNSTSYWKLMVTAVNTTAAQFDLRIDMANFTSQFTNYAATLQEQWLNVNATNVRQDLCIKTGSMGAEFLIVQVWHGGSWKNLLTLSPNSFNNASLSQYIDSTNLTIRFVDSNNVTDPAPDSWNIDSVYLKDEPDVNFLVNMQDSTFTLELLQNGTMRWIGQNMQLTTDTLPVPPLPVRAIHVNVTIGGIDQEVPFQIEDWGSGYQIPLGLTGNTTVFGNRQMIVFLLNSKVSDFTVWWDGSDQAFQTPLAYTNRYFTDNVPSNTLNNGRLRLQFATSGFTLTSTIGSVISTSNLMRINNREDTTTPELSYVITNGVVRDVVLGEAEYTNGLATCPNIYTNIVITLPTNVTYYTYQLHLMFIASTPARTISDLSPIRLSTGLSSPQLQTENDTLAGFPIVQNGTGTFLNSASADSWTAHHFSQFISDTGKGAGILFTDKANQKLYQFDSFTGSSSKGALKASSSLIELLPVSSPQVQFQYAYDITWHGAVATFDNTTPVCSLYDGTTPAGLWILAEYPPTLTVSAKS
jgi:hypothetical protein